MISQIIFSQRCVLCGVQDNYVKTYFLCRRCFKTLFVSTVKNRCIKCGKELISEKNICMRCRTEDYAFDSNFSCWEYSGDVKQLIQLYKFKNCRKLSGFFALKFYRTIKKRYNSLKLLIIPVPCSRERIKKYGMNHIELICRILSRKYLLNTLVCLRRKNGRQIKTLSKEERRSELKGKIYIQKNKIKILEKYKDFDILLLDDIFTTGSTVSECAEILKAAGFKNVYVLTAALD